MINIVVKSAAKCLECFTVNQVRYYGQAIVLYLENIYKYIHIFIFIFVYLNIYLLM